MGLTGSTGSATPALTDEGALPGASVTHQMSAAGANLLIRASMLA